MDTRKGHKSMYMKKDFRHMIIKFIILNKIKCGKTYSYSLIKDIKKIEISKFMIKDKIEIKNDVYNTIASLEKAELIKVTNPLENGKRRKYYNLTPKGRSVLKEAYSVLPPILKELNKILG